MVDIAPATSKDLPETAHLHSRHLRLGLFPRLGRGFLAHYQQSFIDFPHGIALVARQNGKVIGALFATASNARHYGWVVRNCGLSLALRAASAMAVRPDAAMLFMRTRLMRYCRAVMRRLAPRAPKPNVTAEGAAPAEDISVLSHIVISDALRRKGVGRKLVAAYRKQARKLGAARPS